MSFQTRTIALAAVAALLASGAVQAASIGIASGQLTNDVVINEIDYNPDSGPEWLELFNNGAAPVDLSNWEVDGFGTIIPAATTLAAGDYLIVTEDIAAFQAEYPAVTAQLILAGGGLRNGGELIELLDATAVVVDAVDYDDELPDWPTQPDGFGPTLSLFSPTSDNSVPASWGISATNTGTPGAANDTVAPPAPPQPDIVINELHYNPDGTSVEFVELFNAEATSVDVSGWDIDGLFIFPAGTVIASGDFLVITQDSAGFAVEYPGVPVLGDFDFDEGLSNGGETVNLFNDTGVVVDTVTYEDGGPWPGTPDGDGPSLELSAPGLDNTLPGSWQASSLNGGSPGAPNDVIPACNGLAATVDIGASESPTAGNDIIFGTPDADVINGLGGDDIICGEGGDDIINAGPGNDTVFAGDGDDTVFGLDGEDTLYGNTGNDELIGFADDDTLEGGDGDDTINGGLGDDTIEGDDGNDTIFGQGGDDIIDGGNGDDAINGVDGNDQIDGDDGNDLINAGPGDDQVNGEGDDDTIFGLTGADTLEGEDGNDTIFGQGGDDVLDGGDGDDRILGNEGDDQIVDPSGANTLNGGAGNDTVTGGDDADQIFGDGDLAQAGNDILDGGAGADLILGFAGDDTITANDGVVDTVNGGPGTDACNVDVGASADTVFNCEN